MFLKRTRTLLFGALFAVASLLVLVPAASATFGSGDPCGYFTGTTDTYATGQVLFGYYPKTSRVCIDEAGYVDDTSSSSLSYHSSLGKMNWNWGGVSDLPLVDLETGMMSGYVRFDALMSQMADGTIPPNEMWLWLDWKCQPNEKGVDPCSADYSKLRPHVNLLNGNVSGFAWSDHLYQKTGNGYVFLNGIDVELPPTQVQLVVDVVTPEDVDQDGKYDGDVDLEDANLASAPQADGAQFWRVRVRAYNTVGSSTLDSSEITISNLTVVETSDSGVLFDQVNTRYPGAVEETGENLALSCAPSTDACELNEWDGTGDTSFNRFVYSGAPTSNMLGMDTDSDKEVEYISDRDGCPWIYYDQWALKLGAGTKPTCTGFVGDKDDVFYARDIERNEWEIDYITFNVSSATPQTIELIESDNLSCTAGQCMYDFDDEEAVLKFAPRFQVQELVAVYDGASNLQISDDINEVMDLDISAIVEDRSTEYVKKHGVTAGSPVGYSVHYQLDIESDGDASPDDFRLLMDEDPNYQGQPDHSYFDESISSGAFQVNYDRTFNMEYGQDVDLCPGSSCDPPSNSVANPTAEVWVCDKISEASYGYESCYYTAYLPIQDRFADPEDMAVYGAINSTLDESDLLDASNSEDVAILGSTDNFRRRNILNSYLTRLVLGHDNPSGGEIDADGVVSGDVLELMGGTLYYAEGDVTVSGAFTGTLAVKGGNVFIDADIDGDAGEAGILAFADNGVGGNVYVHPDVTTIVASLFLDGSFQSYSGATGDVETLGYMDWATPAGTTDVDEYRMLQLSNQLYLLGSLVSRNTVGGSASGDCASTPCEKGDGTTTTVDAEALEYDLNEIRQYRLCYPLDSSGNVNKDDSLKEVCDEGDTGLSDYGEDNEIYGSFVIEYAAPGSIPVFVLESSRGF